MVEQREGGGGGVGEPIKSGNESNSVIKEELTFLSWQARDVNKNVMSLEWQSTNGVDQGAASTDYGLEKAFENGISVEERPASEDDVQRRILTDSGWNISQSMRKNGKLQWYYRSPDGWLGSSLSSAIYKWRLKCKNSNDSENSMPKMSERVSAEGPHDAMIPQKGYTEDFNEPLKRRKIEGLSLAGEQRPGQSSVSSGDGTNGAGDVFGSFISLSQKPSVAVKVDENCGASSEAKCSSAKNFDTTGGVALQHNSPPRSYFTPPSEKSTNNAGTGLFSQELEGQQQLAPWATQPRNSNAPQGTSHQGFLPLSTPIVDDNAKLRPLTEQQPSWAGKDVKQGNTVEGKEQLLGTSNPSVVKDDDESRGILKEAGWNISQSVRKNGKVQWYYRSPNGCLLSSLPSAMSKWRQMNEERSGQRGGVDNQSPKLPIAKRRKRLKDPQPKDTDSRLRKSVHIKSEDGSLLLGTPIVGLPERIEEGVSRNMEGFSSPQQISLKDSDECMWILQSTGWRISQSVRKNGKVQWYFRAPNGSLLSSFPAAMDEWRKMNEQKQGNIHNEKTDTIPVKGHSSKIYEAVSPSSAARKTESGQEIDQTMAHTAWDVSKNRVLKWEVPVGTKNTYVDSRNVSQAPNSNFRRNVTESAGCIMRESHNLTQKERPEACSLLEQIERSTSLALTSRGDGPRTVDNRSPQSEKLQPGFLEAPPPKMTSMLNSQQGPSLLGTSSVEDGGYMGLMGKMEAARQERAVHQEGTSYAKPLGSLSYQDVFRDVENSYSPCPSSRDDDEGMQILKTAGWRISQSIRKNGRVQWYFRSPNGCLLSNLYSALNEWRKTKEEQKQSYDSNNFAPKFHRSHTETGNGRPGEISKAPLQAPSPSLNQNRSEIEPGSTRHFSGDIVKIESGQGTDQIEPLTARHFNGDVVVNAEGMNQIETCSTKNVTEDINVHSEASPRIHDVMCPISANGNGHSFASKLDFERNAMDSVKLIVDQSKDSRRTEGLESSSLEHGQSTAFQVSMRNEGLTRNPGLGICPEATPVQNSTLVHIRQAQLKDVLDDGIAGNSSDGVVEKINKSWTRLTGEIKLEQQSTRLLSPEGCLASLC